MTNPYVERMRIMREWKEQTGMEATGPFSASDLDIMQAALTRMRGSVVPPADPTAATEALPVVVATKPAPEPVDPAKLTPGSAESLIRGCECSALLNAWGAGIREYVGQEPVSTAWLVDPVCPLHERKELPAPADEKEPEAAQSNETKDEGA